MCPKSSSFLLFVANLGLWAKFVFKRPFWGSDVCSRVLRSEDSEAKNKCYRGVPPLGVYSVPHFGQPLPYRIWIT